VTTRDPRRRTHVEPDADAPAVRDGEVQTTESDPTAVAPGVPIARPDPSKPYPEEDVAANKAAADAAAQAKE